MKRRFFLKTFALFTLPLLVPIAILGFFSISLTQNYIRNETVNSNLRRLDQTKETVEVLFSEIDSQRINFNMNAGFISKLSLLLEKDVVNFADKDVYDSFVNYMNVINPPVNAKPYIDSLYVYIKNGRGNFLASNQNLANLSTFYDTTWYPTYSGMSSETDFLIETRVVKKFDFEAQGTPLLTIYSKLYRAGMSKEQGVIVLNVRKSYIEDMLKSLVSSPGQAILLVDVNGNRIAGANDDFLGSQDIHDIGRIDSSFFTSSIEGRPYIVSQIESIKYGLHYMSITPTTEFYRLSNQMTALTLVLVGLSLILGVFFTFAVTRRNYRNLNAIVDTLQSAESGNPLPALPERIKDEYSFILNNIIRTFVEQSYLKVQLSEKKYRLKTMELLALQSQINPHFVSNALKTIFWKSISLTGEQNDVSRMTEYLSSILQYSLGDTRKTVTLEEEISNTQSYIEIQKYRYRDKFLLTWQYDTEIVSCKVMKLMLQPLIENAIYHGIKEKDCPGRIRVRIRMVDRRLNVAIVDNGAGMLPDKLREVRENLRNEDDSFEHIGLLNTYRRLHLVYGESLRFEILSKAGIGTAVHFSFPTDSASIPEPL